jgi:hypothetical protein
MDLNARHYAIAATLILSACFYESPQDNKPTQEAKKSFVSDIPANCMLNGGDRQIDFAVFRVVCDGVFKVGIYVGDAPNIGEIKNSFAVRADIPNRGVIVKISDPEEKVRGYIWSTPYKWPSKIHVWIPDSQIDDTIAKNIASSIQPTSPIDDNTLSSSGSNYSGSALN